MIDRSLCKDVFETMNMIPPESEEESLMDRMTT